MWPGHWSWMWVKERNNAKVQDEGRRPKFWIFKVKTFTSVVLFPFSLMLMKIGEWLQFLMSRTHTSHPHPPSHIHTPSHIQTHTHRPTYTLTYTHTHIHKEPINSASLPWSKSFFRHPTEVLCPDGNLNTNKIFTSAFCLKFPFKCVFSLRDKASSRISFFLHGDKYGVNFCSVHLRPILLPFLFTRPGLDLLVILLSWESAFPFSSGDKRWSIFLRRRRLI